ncbi:Fe-S cluster assembly protein IscX [Marinobacter hydrocarbonoclasticus]|nr:Fe-S cluster assembly protein IscX [Marinobacter nauticus]
MGLKWIDVQDIAIELSEQKPDVDPTQLRFVELREWVLALDDFDDDPDHCGEKVLEAIQQAWIDEMD